MSRITGVFKGALGLAVALIVLFFITYLIAHYTPSPVNKIGTIVEKFAQPHS